MKKKASLVWVSASPITADFAVLDPHMQPHLEPPPQAATPPSVDLDQVSVKRDLINS